MLLIPNRTGGGIRAIFATHTARGYGKGSTSWIRCVIRSGWQICIFRLRAIKKFTKANTFRRFWLRLRSWRRNSIPKIPLTVIRGTGKGRISATRSSTAAGAASAAIRAWCAPRTAPAMTRPRSGSISPKTCWRRRCLQRSQTAAAFSERKRRRAARKNWARRYVKG